MLTLKIKKETKNTKTLIFRCLKSDIEGDNNCSSAVKMKDERLNKFNKIFCSDNIFFIKHSLLFLLCTLSGNTVKARGHYILSELCNFLGKIIQKR